MDNIKNYFSRVVTAPQRNLAEFKLLTPKDKKRKVVDLLLNNALYILIIALVIYVQGFNSYFLSWPSIVNILTLSAPRLVMALGIAGCVVLTGTDLSAGRILGLTAVICASLSQPITNAVKMYPGIDALNPIFPLLIVMVVGAFIGAFNGFCVAKFKLHPFIVTLGTQLIVYGLALVYIRFGANTTGASIGGLSETYVQLVIRKNFIFPNVVWFALLATVIMWFIWNKTTFGKNMFAVGCNEEAARVSGVSVTKTIIMVFALAGLMYGVTGWLESARIGSNQANTGNGYELDAISACVIGGVSFTGGVGKIRGVIMGVILLQLITAALLFLEVPPAYNYIVKGMIIIIAVAIDMRKYLAKK